MVELAHWELFLHDDTADGSDFDDSQLEYGNPYFSDQDNQFSLDEATHTPLRNMRRGWSTQDASQPRDIPSEIAIEVGSSAVHDHESDHEIPRGASIAHNLIKRENSCISRST